MLSWLFQFDSPDALADTATIKYTYVNSAGSKVGSLGSWDIAIQGRPVSTIPEPISMLLTGTGIVPPDNFTLKPDDAVRISISGIGTLENPVVEV